MVHKLSVMDAIEMAAMHTGAWELNEPEGLVLGRTARASLLTLPQFREETTQDGILPVDGEFVRLGFLGRRCVWYDDNQQVYVKVFSPFKMACVVFQDI